MAFQMLAIIAIGTGIGYYIDYKTHSTTKLWTAGLSLLFVGIALYNVIKSVLQDA